MTTGSNRGKQLGHRTDWPAFYREEVKPRLGVENVFGELPRARMSGGKLRAPCPLHHGSHPNFVVDPRTLSWFCHSKCSLGGGPLEFVHRSNGREGLPRGQDFIAAVNELAERIGVRPDRDPAPSPSTHDAERVWDEACAVTSDAVVSRWLAIERGIDPDLIATLDLARVVSPTDDLPVWAGFERGGQWKSWASCGYRVVVPLVGADGRIRSLRFRNPSRGMQGRSATGVSGIGLVMADSIACSVLNSGRVPGFWNGPFSIVIAEGEPDFWSWATEPARSGIGHGATSFPPVLGVVSGSFEASIAARLPVGTHVISAVDRDEGGDRIHARLARVLADANRGFALSRWKAP